MHNEALERLKKKLIKKYCKGTIYVRTPILTYIIIIYRKYIWAHSVYAENTHQKCANGTHDHPVRTPTKVVHHFSTSKPPSTIFAAFSVFILLYFSLPHLSVHLSLYTFLLSSSDIFSLLLVYILLSRREVRTYRLFVNYFFDRIPFPVLPS